MTINENHITMNILIEEDEIKQFILSDSALTSKPHQQNIKVNNERTMTIVKSRL